MSAWEDLYAEYKDFLHNNSTVQAYWDKAKNGEADYDDAMKYSQLIGTKMFELVEKHIGIQTEITDYESYAEDVAKAIQNGYTSTAYFTKYVQQAINDDAGVGMRVIEPKLAEGRLDYVKNALKLGAMVLTANEIINDTDAAVTDTIEANAEMQEDAGLTVYVTRDTFGRCCDWCEEHAGTYVKGEEPDGFWSKHTNCSCEWFTEIRKNTRTGTISSGRTRVR